MTTAEIRRAMAGRRTVRILYSRSGHVHRVDLRQGERTVGIIATGLVDEHAAEDRAKTAAALLNLDISREDVP